MSTLNSAYRDMGRPRLILAVVVEDVGRVRVSCEGWQGMGASFDEALENMLAIREAAQVVTRMVAR